MFWEGLSLLSKIFFCVGVGASSILLIQIILMIVGFASGSMGDVDGFDSDVDGDGDIDVDDAGTGTSVGLFTVRGAVAFLALGSWTGFAMDNAGCHIALTISISVLVGIIALVCVALLYKLFSKLQSNGILNIENAVGKTAEVYLTIPANNTGVGKIMVQVQDRLVEVNARTKDASPLHTGTMVKVVGVVNGDLLVENL